MGSFGGYLLFALVPVILILRSAWFKGQIGEFKVNFGMKLLLNRDVFRLFKNVTLPFEDGTTQIDHILVSVYGVFVVETKNLRGWITRHTDDPAGAGNKKCHLFAMGITLVEI